MSGYGLLINEVEEKHAGVFTVSLGHQATGLSRNLSYTLVVEGELTLTAADPEEMKLCLWLPAPSAARWTAGSSSSMRGIWGLVDSRPGLT